MFSKCSRNKRWNELGDCSFIPTGTCHSREVGLQVQGCSRDNLKTQGLEIESSKAELVCTTVVYRQRRCLFFHGRYRNPTARTALWRCQVLSVDSWKTGSLQQNDWSWKEQIQAFEIWLPVDSVLSVMTSLHQGDQSWKMNQRSWLKNTTEQSGRLCDLNWEVPERSPSRTTSLRLPQQAVLCNREGYSQFCWRCPQPMSFNSPREIKKC